MSLTANAGAGGLVVNLTSNNTAAATVPATVTVPAGVKSATFTVTTKPVTSVKKPQIQATLEVSKTATLTVNP